LEQKVIILDLLLQLNTLTGEHRLEDIIDERCGDVEVEAVESILDIAAMCTDADPRQRPSMSTVLKMLEEILSPFMSELCYKL
jgi:hypothetical protein